LQLQNSENIYASHHLQGAGHMVSAVLQAAQLVAFCNVCDTSTIRCTWWSVLLLLRFQCTHICLFLYFSIWYVWRTLCPGLVKTCFLTNKKLSWCWQTRATHLEVSEGHQT